VVFSHSLLEEPADADVQWLASVATGGDIDRARWELRYARRALGLLVAQRDALDDRTGSAVAREVLEALASDRNVGAGMARLAERQFNHRLRGYSEALGVRGTTSAGARLGRALFSSAGLSRPMADDDVRRAGALLERYLAAANASLREVFGAASLPEHVPPSEAQAGPGR
jgi:hypothetical protein